MQDEFTAMYPFLGIHFFTIAENEKSKEGASIVPLGGDLTLASVRTIDAAASTDVRISVGISRQMILLNRVSLMAAAGAASGVAGDGWTDAGGRAVQSCAAAAKPATSFTSLLRTAKSRTDILCRLDALATGAVLYRD